MAFSVSWSLRPVQMRMSVLRKTETIVSFVMMFRTLYEDGWEPQKLAELTRVNLSDSQMSELLALGGRPAEQLDYLYGILFGE